MALAEGPGELRPVSGSGEAAELPDRRSLYEGERERAEARARCDAGPWKSRWEASRRRLRGVVAATREARRVVRRPLALQLEVERLRRRGRVLEKALDARGAEVRSLRRVCGEADAALRKALRVSRRRKETIGKLRRDRARLGGKVRALRRRIKRLEGRLAELRESPRGEKRRKGRSGGASERRERPRSKRPRGRQPGAPGHGRTERPLLEEHTEEHDPPPDARVCGDCGSPYAANGAEESSLVEIEVRAHRRVIRRRRWRRTCGCASSPPEVKAPPVPRLFPRTPYGTSFWARFLFERHVCLRPLHRVSAWLSDHGLPVSPGTLADSVHRFGPLFEPLDGAILAHQNGAGIRHADETSWRVQELRGGDGPRYAWLWISASGDSVRFHIDPSRSAEAAAKLFDEAMRPAVLVCDRYSSYKKLARVLGDRVTLSFCWV